MAAKNLDDVVDADDVAVVRDAKRAFAAPPMPKMKSLTRLPPKRLTMNSSPLPMKRAKLLTKEPNRNASHVAADVDDVFDDDLMMRHHELKSSLKPLVMTTKPRKKRASPMRKKKSSLP